MDLTNYALYHKSLGLLRLTRRQLIEDYKMSKSSVSMLLNGKVWYASGFCLLTTIHKITLFNAAISFYGNKENLLKDLGYLLTTSEVNLLAKKGRLGFRFDKLIGILAVVAPKTEQETRIYSLGLDLATTTFDDKDYLDKYIDLIQNNLANKPITSKTQNHHIIPKALFNNVFDKYRVNLSHKDHLLAHFYLYKAFPKEVVLSAAFCLMADISKGASSLPEKEAVVVAEAYSKARVLLANSRLSKEIFSFYHPKIGVCRTWITRLVDTYPETNKKSITNLTKGRIKKLNNGWTLLENTDG